MALRVEDSNMAKKNGKWIIGIVTLIILVLGCIMTVAKTYFVLPAEVGHQAKNFAEMKDENDKDHDQFMTNDKIFGENMIEIKTDMKYMRKDMAAQKELTSKIWEKVK